jgi:anti-anti-sigma factor
VIATSISLHDKNVLLLSGRLCGQTVGQLWQKGQQLIKGQTAFTVDLADVSFCDSAGLALLIELLRDAKRHNQAIHYINVPKQLLAIAKVSGVEGWING